MKASVVCLYFWINFAILQLFYAANQGQNLYVKSVFCKANEKFVHKNFTCFAKSYSRKVSTVTIVFYYKKLWDNSVVMIFKSTFDKF